MNSSQSFSIILVFALFVAVGLQFSIPFPTPEEKVVYQTIKEYVNRTVEVPIWNVPEIRAEVKGVGVYPNTTEGELIVVGLILRGGNGSIYLDVADHSFGSDFQNILQGVKTYAEEYANKRVGYRDFIVKIDSSAAMIQGTSGGAAMAVGLISLLLNKTLVPDVVISAVLRADGTFGKVDAIHEKAIVAQKQGVKKMLIPQSQCDDVTAPAGLELVCVMDMDEAVGYMII